jgi:hypothetical protein
MQGKTGRVFGAAVTVPIPVNTPSLRMENKGKDVNVNLIPLGSAGVWGASSSSAADSTEQANAQLGAFFQEAGIELCQNYDQNLEYQFIVDDYLSEITNLPRIQTKVQIASTCEGNVRAFLDEKHLTADVVKALLTNYFGSAEFDLVDRYSQAYQNIYTLKIHDFLNMGYFIDTIVIEAYKSNFDFEKIRRFQ